MERRNMPLPGPFRKVSDGTRTRDRLDHNQELAGARAREYLRSWRRSRSCLQAARRLPGVHAGAQPRLSASERRVRDICDFQDFRVLEPPGVAAVPSTTHNREVGGRIHPELLHKAPQCRVSRLGPRRKGRVGGQDGGQRPSDHGTAVIARPADCAGRTLLPPRVPRGRPEDCVAGPARSSRAPIQRSRAPARPSRLAQSQPALPPLPCVARERPPLRGVRPRPSGRVSLRDRGDHEGSRLDRLDLSVGARALNEQFSTLDGGPVKCKSAADSCREGLAGDGPDLTILDRVLAIGPEDFEPPAVGGQAP
jgi:hypothetical protein